MLGEIKGIGPKMIETLKKIDVKSIDDLINYYPYKYNVIIPTKLTPGEVVISGVIESMPISTYIKKNLNKMNFRIDTGEHLVNVIIFNRAFMKNNLKRGTVVTVVGEYDEKRNSILASDIRLKKIDGELIEPVYHLSSGLNSRHLHTLINNALQLKPRIVDFIPEYLNEEYGFKEKKEALGLIHNPPSLKAVKDSIVRFKYEELFKFMFKINYLKSCRNKEIGLKRDIPKEKVNDFIKDLPFDLTTDQRKAVDEILEDMTNEKRMNRLVLGDVGSGKTIIAEIAIFFNTLASYQSALLVPTEILASQHFLNISKIFLKYGIRTEILKGKMSKKERTKVLEGVKNGEVDLLIGTHAILEDDVEFKNLGLVITDEQHRFGVNQRNNFHNKGMLADILYMSATPIPRTYALVIYGDMDISTVKTKPSGRKPVKTSLVKFKDIKKVLSEMLEEIKKNHQVYIVCPLIESDEESPIIDVKNLKEKIDIAYKGLVPCEVLHGKMKPQEKEKIMTDFKEGRIKILISTTVIEVGVDVPNATMMVIFNAERFGLSTIHQLRGRIGRNSLESKCIMVSDKNAERLKVLVESNDGFYISDQDFKMRGEGDLFGTRQSGEMIFKIADLRSDLKILTQCNIDSSKFIDENKENNFKNYPEYLKLIEKITHLD